MTSVLSDQSFSNRDKNWEKIRNSETTEKLEIDFFFNFKITETVTQSLEKLLNTVRVISIWTEIQIFLILPLYTITIKILN